MRDLDIIDSELRLLAAVRRTAAKLVIGRVPRSTRRPPPAPRSRPATRTGLHR